MHQGAPYGEYLYFDASAFDARPNEKSKQQPNSHAKPIKAPTPAPIPVGASGSRRKVHRKQFTSSWILCEFTILINTILRGFRNFKIAKEYKIG